MKITKTQLKQIIKEELEAVLDEKMGLPPEVEVHPDSPEGVQRKCTELGATHLDIHKCVANPVAYEKKKLADEKSTGRIHRQEHDKWADAIRRQSGYWEE